MAEQEIRPISSGTGTFAAIDPTVRRAEVADSGSEAPASGNKVPEAEASRPNLEEIARQLNIASQSIGRDLRFEVDLNSGRSVIQVLDRETGEIIRQIPPEKAGAVLQGSGSGQIRLYDERV